MGGAAEAADGVMAEKFQRRMSPAAGGMDDGTDGKIL
jgi:hypothetical protein